MSVAEDQTPNGSGDLTAVELGRHWGPPADESPRPAFGVYAGARDLGLNISEDFFVVGVDILTLTEVVEPSLTAVE